MDKASKPTRAVIYTRVSRDDSGEGKSNRRQEEDCRMLANLRGWEVVAVHDDISVSAYSGKVRPGWQQVLDRMRGGDVDVVLAWKMDRVTRTVRELSDIIALSRDTSVAIVTTDGDLDLSSEAGKAVATILGAVAEMEVERKGARQKRANAQRRAEGKPWRSGWASFGYNLDKEVIPEQATLIQHAAEAVLEGASLKSIARTWRASGVSTPRSNRGASGWTHNGVKTILLNPVNAGINTYKGREIGRGEWEAILSEATLRQLQALLSDSSRRTYAGNGRRAENLLSGIAICAVCEFTVHAGVSNGQKVYKCSNPLGDHITTDRAAADEFVLGALTTGREAFVSHRVLPVPETMEGAPDLLAELAALDRREGVITERFSRGSLADDTWSLAVAAIEQQRQAIRQRMGASTGERTASVLAKARVTSFLTLSLADRRTTLNSIANVELHPRNRRRNVPLSQQVSVWAKDTSRLGPLVAGTHPESLRRRDEVIREREAAKIATLPSCYADN